MNFVELLTENGFTLNQNQLDQLQQYCDLLIEWNQKFNLTAITEKDEIYVKHFLDCLLLTNYNLQGSLADVGTGAGFPAIVLKIANPDLKITMLEPNNKRISFLNEVIRVLELKDIEAVNKRSEDYARENNHKFDFVTSRAVASLNILSELCIPLLKVNGHFLAMKGPKAQEELQQSENALATLGGKVVSLKHYNLNDENTRYIIDIIKEKKTEAKYPRNYGQIKKKPL